MMLKNLFLVLLLAATSAAFTTRLKGEGFFPYGLPEYLRRPFDTDGNGQLNDEEFLRGVKKSSEILHLFRATDKNEDKVITEEEFTNIHEAEHFNKYDKNDSGKLGLREFLKYFCNELHDPKHNSIYDPKTDYGWIYSLLDDDWCLKYKNKNH